MCDKCRLVKYARVLPYHCECGLVHWAGTEPPPKKPPKPRTFGRIIREMVGCGCNPLPWQQWDRRGIDWCRNHADEIAAALAGEKRTGLDLERARELVQRAISIASRQAADDRPAT